MKDENRLDGKSGSERELLQIRRFLSENADAGVWSSLQILANRAAGNDPPRGSPADDRETALSPPEVPESSKLAKVETSRRDLLQWLSGAAALLASTACTRQAPEALVPYATAPELVIPGKPLFYATAFPFEGLAQGLVVESHLGRPTKVEGNEHHPASLGASDPFSLASILSLYDPDRPKAPTRQGKTATWNQFTLELEQLKTRTAGRAGSIRILTPPIFSPTFAQLIQRALGENPSLLWHQHSPVGSEQTREGNRLAFGRPLNTYFDLSKADIILSLDSDFLLHSPAKLRYARQYADRRDPDSNLPMNRLYSVHSTTTLTSGKADHRLCLKPSEIISFTNALAAILRNPAEKAGLPLEQEAWLQGVAADLLAHRGRSLVVVDETQDAPVHALVHAMNDALGNFGSTILVTEPIEASVEAAPLADLLVAMEKGDVEGLLIIDSNPAYEFPADLNFAAALRKVPFKAQLSLFRDETTTYCDWHIPLSHYLETWGDLSAFDGTVTIQQPLLERLHASRSTLEFMSAFLGNPGIASRALVYESWKSRRNTEDFDGRFRRWLERGVVENSALPVLNLRPTALANPIPILQENGPGAAEDGLEIIFRPDPTVWDGRYSNNAWLQELPKPISKLTWDNAASIAPSTAAKSKLGTGDLVELSWQGRKVVAPVLVASGYAPGTVTLSLGYGRRNLGRIANGRGYDANLLRTQGGRWQGKGLTLRKVGSSYPFAITQGHRQLYDRDIIRRSSLSEYLERRTDLGTKEFPEEKFQPTIPTDPAKFLPREQAPEHQWAMSVDLNRCIGCNACVLGCQSENNIAVVGKEEVMRGREMHWIRVDTYFSDDLDDPDVHFQPLPCMHCETAPCEVVCPVNATTHSQDGLNQMVYNRCVGTRYCSNNCPYKVRFFNFFRYSNPLPLQRLVYNPDVTVRSRGVMEKCNYCIQRITAARIDAETERRSLRPDEVKTACQQACPTQAIVFGNLKDPAWQINERKKRARDYSLLDELNTKPRTTYLAKVTNPNPALEQPRKPRGDAHD